MNKYAVWKLKGIDGPNTGPVKGVGVATGDEIETGVPSFWCQGSPKSLSVFLSDQATKKYILYIL